MVEVGAGRKAVVVVCDYHSLLVQIAERNHELCFLSTTRYRTLHVVADTCAIKHVLPVCSVADAVDPFLIGELRRHDVLGWLRSEVRVLGVVCGILVLAGCSLIAHPLLCVHHVNLAVHA